MHVYMYYVAGPFAWRVAHMRTQPTHARTCVRSSVHAGDPLQAACSAVTADKVDGAGGPQLRVPVVRGVLDVPPTAAVLSGARTSLGYARVSPGRTRASRRRRMPVVVWPAQQGMVMGVFGRSAKSSALLPPPSKTLRTSTNTQARQWCWLWRRPLAWSHLRQIPVCMTEAERRI